MKRDSFVIWCMFLTSVFFSGMSHSDQIQATYFKPAALSQALTEEMAKWRKENFASLLAGIIMKSTNADVVFFEKGDGSAHLNDQKSQRTYLMRPDHVTTITLSGKQIKHIAKLIAKQEIKDTEMFGVDKQARTVHGRKLNDNERFRVALNEKTLFALFGIAKVGGLNEIYANRAPYIEGIYSKITELFFIAGPKIMETTDTADSLARMMKELELNVPLDKMVDDYLAHADLTEIQSIVKYQANEPKSALTLNISYLDLGFSSNITNETYKDYQSPQTRFSAGRGKVPGGAHLFLNSKMELTYDAPQLISTLGANVKFMQVDFNKKPDKDKTKLSLNFRLPWERSLFQDKSIVVSPILNNTYELTLAPIPFLSNQSEEALRKDKVLPRAKTLMNLLGAQIDFTDLGFSLETGPLLSSDFNRPKEQAFDYGFGLNLAGRWPLFGPLELSGDLTSYYLFPFQAGGKDRVAMVIDGTVWLRIARFHDFSISLMNDFFIASLQEAPKDLAISSIFGATISLQRLFRIFG